MSAPKIKNMMCLDFYLHSLTPEVYKSIQPKLKKSVKTIHPLHSWDIVLMQRAQQDALRERKQSDILKLEELQRIFKWNICLPEVLATNYDALVLTDNQKIIQWVNAGFYSMTGYQPEEAIGQSPRFLQGPLTSSESLESLKKGFIAGEPFYGQVVNYRKEGDTYNCKLQIFPLRNHQDVITNYLAVEKESFA